MTPAADTSSGCWHRAGWVVVDPATIYPNAMVHIRAGRITAVQPRHAVGRHSGRRIGPCRVIDHGPGAIVPALINAHTHLELCALKGKLPVDRGFATWVRHLIQYRETLGSEQLAAGILSGIAELTAAGCGAIGEIATLGRSRAPFRQSSLAGIWFREWLGHPVTGISGAAGDSAETLFDVDTLPSAAIHRESLAGHAPHSTSPVLLQQLKQVTRRAALPFSIHVAESDAESEFIRTKNGPWADLLTARRIDFSHWPLPAPSPVVYLDRLNLLDTGTLAVHALRADANDFRILARRGTTIAVCPRSNQRLHQRLPDLDRMLAAGLTLCLATDSLASCDSLSLFDEMAFTARHFPALSPRTLFAMATINGARALGLEKICGRLAPGCRADGLYLELAAATPDAVLTQIVTHRPIRPVYRFATHLS